MVKKALLVGCNYPGTKAELNGCVNDVKRMQQSLIDRFGFSNRNITVMIDTDPDFVQPTGANIRKALEQLVYGAQEGDILFFHYSGHGVRLPAESGENDDTGYDECIVPTDMNLIADDDFRQIVDKVPRGCRFTIVSDSCHSGGLIEQAKEQVGGGGKNSSSGGLLGLMFQGVQQVIIGRGEEELKSRGLHIPSSLHKHLHHHKGEDADPILQYQSDEYNVKNRSLPLSTFLELLKQKTGRQDVTVGNIRPTLFDVFGEDASPKVKKFVKLVIKRLQAGKSEGFWGTVGGLAQDFVKMKLEQADNKQEYSRLTFETILPDSHDAYAGVTEHASSDMGILVSGCQSHETSADANPTGNPDGAYGALSNAIQAVLSSSERPIGNRELVLSTRELLARQGFKQNPCLYCADEYADAPFVCD